MREGEQADATRFFADGGFFTPDRKARFVAPEAPALREVTSDGYPFVLNTGRVRDQWHTMTRSGLSPRLGQHTPEPFVEVHPADARFFGLKDFRARRDRPWRGRLPGAFERRPTARIAVRADPLERRDRIVGARRRAGRAAYRSVFGPARGEGDAGAHRAGRIRLARLRRSRAHPVALPAGTWWARVTLPGGTGTLFATHDRPERWREHAAAWMAGERAEFIDLRRGIYRAASFHEGRLEAALFVGPADVAPQWDAVKVLFETEALGEMQRRMVLSGARDDGLAETGPVICACFGVGLAVIPRGDRVERCDQTSRRSARRCARAPIAAPACRN
jgi:assimilatory nitrate reductase catalytic subunit